MPTVIEKTIKPLGGGDYLSIPQFLAAEIGDLIGPDIVKRAICYSGGNLSNDVAIYTYDAPGYWRTDDDHYIELVTAPGHEHPGYWDESKAFISQSAVPQYAFHNYGVNIHVRGLQVKVVMSNRLCFLRPYGNGSVHFDECLLVCETPSGAANVIFSQCSGGSASNLIRVTHSTVVAKSGNDTYTIGIFTRGPNSVVEAYNNTVIGVSPSNNFDSFSVYDQAVTYSQNNYLGGGLRQAYNNQGGGAAYLKGANDATVNGDATTPALRNIPFSTATFVSVTGTLDLHLAVGSALIDTGADLSAIVGSYDFEGNIRPQGAAWDIGAAEAPPAWKSCDGAATGPAPTAAGDVSRGTYCAGAATGAAPTAIGAADNPTCAGVLVGPSPTAHGHARGSGNGFTGRLFPRDDQVTSWKRIATSAAFRRTSLPLRIFPVQ